MITFIFVFLKGMDSRTLLQGFMLICSVVLAAVGDHAIKVLTIDR